MHLSRAIIKRGRETRTTGDGKGNEKAKRWEDGRSEMMKKSGEQRREIIEGGEGEIEMQRERREMIKGWEREIEMQRDNDVDVDANNYRIFSLLRVRAEVKLKSIILSEEGFWEYYTRIIKRLAEISPVKINGSMGSLYDT
ncbi:hypothetical protein ACLOJK_024569 [Asimina triloba]